MQHKQVIIVSGYSGSGKTKAIKNLETLGYYCVDNLPVELINPFLDLYSKNGDWDNIKSVVISVDIRSTINFENCRFVFNALKDSGYSVKLLFITAEKKVIIQRFQETRNPHPVTLLKSLENKQQDVLSMEEAIEKEFALLEPLRQIADVVLDTSNSTVHELRQQIFELFAPVDERLMDRLKVRIVSFGFSKGIPTDVDLLFDVRFLPNPHFVNELRSLTGKDQPVRDYIDSNEITKKFWQKLKTLIDFLIPEYTKEGKFYLTVGIGCTGGRHRSVMIAEKLGTYLKEQGLTSSVEHRDIFRGN